jgi:hypothetical protein
MLIRGLAAVGIIALVNEATGFQYDRPRRDLEEQLKRFLSENLRKWVRTFPADYFKHLCRLRHVELRPDTKLPQYFGHLTNSLIYRRLAPGLLKKLKERREERQQEQQTSFMVERGCRIPRGIDASGYRGWNNEAAHGLRRFRETTRPSCADLPGNSRLIRQSKRLGRTGMITSRDLTGNDAESSDGE